MFKIALIALVLLFVVAVLTILAGYCLPKNHVASRAISVKQAPETVYSLISDFQHAASWRAHLKSVEMLPPAAGTVRFRETTTDGILIFELVEARPPYRQVTRIADKNLPFGGQWIYEISPTTGGARLTITERGEVYNPVFRLFARYVFGYNRTLDEYLRSVARKFGESPAIVDAAPAAI